jgi:unsaturated chondroitin disaccharide hydrolase
MEGRKEIESLKKETLSLSPPETGSDFWRNALVYCSERIKRNIPVFKDQYPAPASINGVYPIQNTDWTSAFWPGMLCLAFESTGAEQFATEGIPHPRFP